MWTSVSFFDRTDGSRYTRGETPVCVKDPKERSVSEGRRGVDVYRDHPRRGLRDVRPVRPDRAKTPRNHLQTGEEGRMKSDVSPTTLPPKVDTKLI